MSEKLVEKPAANGEGNAFPMPDFHEWVHHGLTKREYFAVTILAGIHASMAEGYSCSDSAAAKKAVASADLLLAALEARP